MSKQQHMLLSLIAGATAFLLLLNVGFGQLNRLASGKIQESQQALSAAPRLQRVAQGLIVRLAKEAQNDREIRKLLSKHGIEIKTEQ